MDLSRVRANSWRSGAARCVNLLTRGEASRSAIALTVELAVTLFSATIAPHPRPETEPFVDSVESDRESIIENRGLNGSACCAHLAK